MVEYLRDHPYVFFPNNAKPHYWASDFPGLRKQTEVATQQDYLALFEPSKKRHVIIGDGSTLYLTSELAIKDILEFNPSAKFVVMLRQPVDLIHSYFKQLRNSGDEDQKDFEAAWAMQDERRQRRSIPKACCERRLLQYRDVAALGQQFDRVRTLVAKDHLQVIFYEDFHRKTRQVYRSVISFLDLPDDDRHEFPLQESKRAPSPIVRSVMRAPLARRFYTGVKNKLSGRIVTTVRDTVLTRSAEVASIRPIFHNRLIDEFSDDIQLLADRTGRNLDHWLARETV
jgi:hypothetical protein